MNFSKKLSEIVSDELKYRLFKRFGDNTDGHPFFIKTSKEISNVESFLRSLKDSEINIYCLSSKAGKSNVYLINNEIEKLINYNLQDETLNIFDQNFTWVITLFDKDLI